MCAFLVYFIKLMEPKSRIRRIKKTDLPRIRNLVSANFGKFYGRCAGLEYAQCFSDVPIRPRAYCLVVNDEIRAIAAVIGSFDYHVEAITWVNVHPRHHRNGYGKQLISHILKVAPRIINYHVLTTRSACGFYEKLGFEVLRNIEITSKKGAGTEFLMGRSR